MQEAICNETEIERLRIIQDAIRSSVMSHRLDLALEDVLLGALQCAEAHRGFIATCDHAGRLIVQCSRHCNGGKIPIQEFDIDLRWIWHLLKENERWEKRSCICLPIFSIHFSGLVDQTRKISGILYLDSPKAPTALFHLENRETAALFALQAAVVLNIATLRDLANFDSLTRLHQRHYFDASAETECRRAFRHNRPLSLILMDLDRFKRVNDLFGHNLGDSVLRRVSAVLKECSRKEDTIARYGGDEFVLLLPETNEAGAVSMACRIRQLVGLVPAPTEIGRITLSAGIASFPDTQAGSTQKLMKCADIALYKAKEEGGDRWITFRPDF